MCGFFRKYYGSRDDKLRRRVAGYGFIQSYCKGPNQQHCARKEYMQAHQTLPSDDLMPDGRFVSADPENGE